MWALLVAGFCSGALFLSFEAVFFRFQLLFFTSLSTTFAVMLAVALAGIAVGGAAAGRFLSRDRHAQSWLPVMSFGAGLALLLSYRWFPAALEPAARMSPVAGALLTTLMLAFPVACLSGAMFTLIGQAMHFAGRSEASATARLTIANTIGGAVGSVSTGFYLIGVFGLEACFRVADPRLHRRRCLARRGAGTTASARAQSLVVGAVVLAMSLTLFPGGVMRDVYQLFPIDALTAAGEHRVAFREGQLETAPVPSSRRPRPSRVLPSGREQPQHVGQRSAQPPIHATARVPAGHPASCASNGGAPRAGAWRHREGTDR